MSLASRVLRQANPKLSKASWVSLIKGVLSAGDRNLAAKLARVARTKCQGLHLLKSSCHITIHCPLPSSLLRLLQRELRRILCRIPADVRTPQFFISSRCLNCKWGKSALIESIVAPALPALQKVGKCNCSTLNGPRVAGHYITRAWHEVPSCGALFRLCGNASLSQRTYPDPEVLRESTKRQALRLLRAAGMEKDNAEDVADRFSSSCKQLLQQWMTTLPPMLLQANMRKALRPVHRAGFLFVRIDRSPGRIVLMCREAWLHLQRTAFMESPRYNILSDTEGDNEYAERMRKSLNQLLCDCRSKMMVKKSKGTGRPYGYWTITAFG